MKEDIIFNDSGVYGTSFSCVGAGGICFVHNGPSKVPTYGDDILIHTGNGVIKGKLTMVPQKGEADDDDENSNYGFEPLNPDEMIMEF